MKKLCLICFAFVASNFAQAQTESDYQISIFKNGSAFYSKKVRLNAENGTSILQKMPNAAYGLLWFNPENNNIKQIKATTQEKETEFAADNMEEIFKANIGKKVNLTYSNAASNVQNIEGVIEAISQNLLRIKTTDKWQFIAISQITSFQFAEKPKDKLSKKTTENIWLMQFGKNNKEQDVEFLYFQKGLAWFPSYQIELLSDEKARISFSAQVVNEVEDFENAKVQLVVGVPNFLFSNLKSPLISTESISNLMSQLGNTSNVSQTYALTNIVSQRRYNYSDNEEADFAANNEEADIEATGEQAGDLFFYDTPSAISLKKGERIALDIFRTDCNYSHCYDAQLPQNRTDGVYSTDFKRAENELDVWHSIHLKNETKTPWTTAPIFAVSKLNAPKPLSQDKITYTPVGAKAKIKLTIASDIVIKEEEKELERKQIKLKDGLYDQISVEAKITINNYKKANTKINVSKMVIGEMQTCDETWKIDKKTGYYSGNNRNNSVNWEVNVDAEKEKVIRYTYQTYVRR